VAAAELALEAAELLARTGSYVRTLGQPAEALPRRVDVGNVVTAVVRCVDRDHGNAERAGQRADAPVLAATSAHAGQRYLVTAPRDEGDEARARIMGRLFEGVITMWVKGQIAAAGVESWTEFHSRVQRGLRAAQEFRTDGNLARSPSGRTVAVFTSAGVIVAAAQRALSLDDEKALALAWHVRNSSVSEFLFSGERWTLRSFNSVPHLPAAEMITYR